MPFKSTQADIDLPRDITIWSWLFENQTRSLPLTAGYTNCFSEERISYANVKTLATHFSTGLRQRYELKHGNVVALFSPNNVWYPVAMFGVSRIGGVISGANPAYNVEEMSYVLKSVKAKLVMTVPEIMNVAIAAAELVGIPRENIILLEGQINGYSTLQDLIEIGRNSSEQAASFKIPAIKSNHDICGFMCFSSGTTGLPKAVMVSHQNIIAQCLQVQQITPASHTKILCVLPLFHITGLVHLLHLPILLNAEVYMLPKFNMRSMLDSVVKYKMGELILVPPILIRMANDLIVDEYDLRHITRFSSGAAPLGEEIIQKLKTRFPQTGFKQACGMTESCSCITAHPPSLSYYKYAHTVGTLCASTEIKIVDEKGEELGIGEPGELLARGPQITMGYLDNEKVTRETFLSDGFMRTGDQATIDAHGIVTITDRLKEIIKVKGIGVAPAELEDLFLSHPHVLDSAVLGIPDDYAGERPKAYVVLTPGAPGENEVEAELMKYVAVKKARHKWIKEIEFVEEIPKSASGKILRQTLRDKSKERKGLGVLGLKKAKL